MNPPTRTPRTQPPSRLGVPQLRDLGVADLARVARLPATLARRARHVLTEDDRVLAAVAALAARDLPSHATHATHAYREWQR